ncbi:glycerol kinase GlpK [Hyphobacterium sp. HN65]|uniref:Glycerol kinase n=1 Tax=Hyphobacterium lacteum TaxID=3116575 RepID=A0ABU7LR30_9PROT|nr:glycerol kinase GlpK [Hyphobacterium sp. HN65]MEE2525779.1 glycerol kinase GlpK [Hyphobacterium sp. HN65]
MFRDKTAILAIDQGTTSSRAIVFSRKGEVISLAQQEFPQIYPKPGWVEHDPEVIWATVIATARRALKDARAKGWKPACIGITNQRETAIVWDRATGDPIHNAIVWQDRRTAQTCQQLAADGHEEMIREKTGLVLDPYFSATKFAFILDAVDGARERAASGELAFGTVDTFLLWRLTGGEHRTDASNASRTSLYDLKAGQWDDGLCRLFGVPMSGLPEVCDNAGPLGTSLKTTIGEELPVTGMAGDQQSAAIGQACFKPGQVKSTYGTGAFLIMNTGSDMAVSENRLLSTVGWRLDGKTTFALEGSILSAGATVQWLRDGLGLFSKASEIEALAASADPDSGVYLVPAFAGLGAPHWAADARGTITGLTRGSGRAEIAQAALDAAAHQTADLLQAMARDGVAADKLKVDGGMSANNRFLQRLADFCGVPVVRPVNAETTAWGAAFLAGLGAGLFHSLEDGRALWQADQAYSPSMKAEQRDQQRSGWQRAVSQALAGV